MFKCICCAASLLLACDSYASYEICGLQHPESVAARGERRFVSNLGEALDPTAADGDGFISELSAGGRLLELRAFTGLDAPKGLVVVKQRLYVADLDRVVGFDLDTRERAFEAAYGSQPTMLNDLAVVDDHTLLVSDTAGSALLQLELGSGTFTLLAREVLGANGIAIDREHEIAYVVGLGTDFSGGGLYEVDLANPGSARAIEGPFGVFDGLALLESGQLLASDWITIDEPVAGRMTVFERSGERGRDLLVHENLHGPADFYYDRDDSLLWIPAMTDNCVRVIEAPR